MDVTLWFSLRVQELVVIPVKTAENQLDIVSSNLSGKKEK